MHDPVHDPEVLIQRYLEDQLTEAESAAFLQLLQTQPELGDRLLHQLHTDAMLSDIKGLSESSTLPFQVIDGEAALPKSTPRRFSLRSLSSVAALAACITLAATWALRFLSPAPDAEATTSAVAVLTQGINLQWEGESHASGSPLTPGWLRLKSGLAQIEFYQGARVTLEGPAAFQLISSSEAYCTSGKLSAHVPPQAKGFRIQTPKGTIVDLGTDFGLDLNDAASPVHVFKGEIEFHGNNSPMQSLKEGQALALSDLSRSMVADQSAFTALNEVDERTAESQRLAFESWLSRSSIWNHDPSLLLRLDFQDNRNLRTLQNHALHAAQVPAGSIVGCDWTDGRWPGKRALEFRNVSDRVRLNLPGQHAALTVSTWVRISGLDRSYNSLFMTEGYADAAAHWQITRDGRLRLGIAGKDGQPYHHNYTAAIITPERYGQWLHLATVIDPAVNEVRHYLNGDLIQKLTRKDIFPVRLTVAELGNWNDGGRHDRVAIRHFSGVMDEFLLFNRALSESEIARLAE
ncbi:MAG: FecR domain-containing protein [Verrucomicrobia bacterium]|nr:FecR domain-containing protein [Verrucomicrobiota bacterium]